MQADKEILFPVWGTCVFISCWLLYRKVIFICRQLEARWEAKGRLSMLCHESIFRRCVAEE